jgi:hypothetical protein
MFFPIVTNLRRLANLMLIIAQSTQAYFRENLIKAIQSSHIVITEEAQAYVVHLLNEFSRSDKAFAGVDHGEKPILVNMLERAYSAEDREALRIFRHLGDISLYLLGFFREFNKTGIVSDTYYRDMGAQAYYQASSLSRAYAAQNAAVFQELSDNFARLVKVLEHIAVCSQNKETH